MITLPRSNMACPGRWFVHEDTSLSHLTPCQVLAKSYSRFETRFHHPLEICLLVCHEIDVLVFSNVFHSLPNTELFMSLKKSFLKSFFAFILCWVLKLMYSGNHVLWSNSIAQ